MAADFSPLTPTGNTSPGGCCRGGGHISVQAAEALPLDCSFANTQAKGTELLPHMVLKSSDLAPDSLLGVYSVDNSAFINTPLKTLKLCRFFVICL